MRPSRGLNNVFYNFFAFTIDFCPSEKDEKWLGIRRETKQVRKNETDMIQKFVDYAISQGSTHANTYYTHLTNLANKRCGIKTGERDKADQKNIVEVKIFGNAD